MAKKQLFLWALYDFANSIVLIGFLFYFSQWLVIEQGKPAWWYNVALVVPSALFIITAPAISRKIDHTKKKLGGLRWWSVATFIGFLITALIALFINGAELVATIFYVLATYAYLTCFLYFTPMLNDLSDKNDRSWKSGIGQAANSIGQVAGVLVTLPFVNGLTLFGDPGKAQALFPAVLIFGVLALPMLLWYREKEVENVTQSAESKPKFTADFVIMFKNIFNYKPLALVLIAYFLFSDALLTFANNFPLYLEVVHGASDTMKSVLTASILILGSIGAAVFGKIADKKGHLRVLRIILVIWVPIFLLMVGITNLKLLIPLFLFAGVLFGPVWGISRALVGDLAKPEQVAASYSYYVLAERFATFIGPAVWSIALIAFGEGIAGYRAGLFSLMILIVISVLVLTRLKKITVSSISA